MPELETNIAARLELVRERIAAAAKRAGRQANEVAIVGATKGQPAEVIAAAARAGISTFGENRIQEAVPKMEALRAAGLDPHFHFIGHLQTNKVKSAVSLFAMVQSVDRLDLARALSRRAEQAQRREFPVLLEVYTGDDPARPGFRPDQLLAEAGAVLTLPALRVQGLMTVAPLGVGERETRAAFTRVMALRAALSERYSPVHWRELSMGMTDDFELAIEAGSTMVRLGRVLFGSRIDG